MSLDVLGAGDGLKTQYVVLRVRDVDIPRLRSAAGKWGGLAAGVVALSDSAPAVLLKAAAPIAQKKLKADYGIDAEIAVTDAPPPPRSVSEFFPGAAVGAAGVGVVAAVVYGIYRLFSRRPLRR